MQIARPHTRFFRLVYDSPKQSDILCGINIRIHIVSAISALERLVSSCADTVAHRASLRSICWLHDNQGYTRHSSLVFHKGAELMEAPRIEFFSKALVPAFGGGAYIGQVLYGNTKTPCFGFHNDLFGNGVVDYRRGSSFFPFKPFQEFGAATFAFVNAAFRAFGLNGTTDFSLLFPVTIQRFGGKGSTIGCTRNIGDSEVATDKFLDIFHILFGNFYRLKKVKLAFLEHKVSFPFDVRNIIGVVADKRHLLSTAYSPYRDMNIGVRKNPAVIADASVFTEHTLTFPVKFVGIRHLAYAAYNYLSGKVKGIAYVIVAKVMQLELIESPVPPCNVRNLIARCISLLESFKKNLMLFFGRDKFYFQCQFHAANIREKSDIFKYLSKNSIN